MKNNNFSNKLFIYLLIGWALSGILQLYMGNNIGIISMIFVSTCVIHDCLNEYRNKK